MPRISVLACVLLSSLAMAQSPLSQSPPPDPRDLVRRNSHVFACHDSKLTGAGADFLRREVARSQFVLLGEDHMDHAIPLFAGALYGMLNADHGFDYLVVEQDPVAIEAILQAPLRGDARKIATFARRYPSLFEFDTDEDLGFLAQVGTIEKHADAIWGVEQTTGAIRYLEELSALAPDASVRERTLQLLADARAADPGPRYSVNWLVDAATPPKLEELSGMFNAAPGSRAARLLAAMAKSSEIFGYYRRAEAGEFVGLYNNTVREEVLKANFLEQYRAAAAGGRLPKALFKFGANHLYRGKNPTQAFPIGNLAHELAIANGMEAYGLFVIMLGDGYVSYADYPAWLRELLPAEPPTVPTLVDLRPLRPYQRLFRQQVEVANQWELLALLHGYDAIVILPGSKPGSRELGGRP